MSSPRSTSGDKASAMKQGKLKFNVKRTGSATGLDKGKTKAKPPPTAEKALSPTIIEDSDSEGSVVVEQKGKRSIKGKAGPAPKKRKIDAEETAESKRKQKGKAVFKSRSSIENVSERRTPPSDEGERPRLNPNDKRWQRIYKETKQKMGNERPIHGEGQNRIHEILRVFDLSYEYGPCIGVTRLERWNRAEALGLNPSPEVRDILMTKEGTELSEYSQCVFHGEV